MITHIKDSQFAKSFLIDEVCLTNDLVQNILHTKIEVRTDGEPDTTVNRGDTLILHSPTSVSRFLFNMLFTSLSPHVAKPEHKDKLGLGLYHRVHQYVYNDYEPHSFVSPAVVTNYSKNPVVSFIMKDLIEPLTGPMHLPDLLFMKCNFTDTCRKIDNAAQLVKWYNLPKANVSMDFPLLLCNTNIRNSPAHAADLTVKTLNMCLGEDKTLDVLTLILKDESLLANLVLIIRILQKEPDFVIEFLQNIIHSMNVAPADAEEAKSKFAKCVESDKYLGPMIRTARDNTTQNKQWSQWSMLMGLIEKQLSPMRGSMWPTSKTIKPHEDLLRIRQKELAKSKGKSQLNFSELLETYRDTFNHKAVEPGKIVEHMLKDNRVWK